MLNIMIEATILFFCVFFPTVFGQEDCPDLEEIPVIQCYVSGPDMIHTSVGPKAEVLRP